LDLILGYAILFPQNPQRKPHAYRNVVSSESPFQNTGKVARQGPHICSNAVCECQPLAFAFWPLGPRHRYRRHDQVSVLSMSVSALLAKKNILAPW